MTDRPKQDSRRAGDFISERTAAGDTPRLRRWSVAMLVAASRFRTDDAVSPQGHPAPRPQTGER
jgi:hypothetical protein